MAIERMPERPVVIADVFAARRRIRRHLSPTPLIHSAWLSDVSGAQASLKLESLQEGRSFKSRGALNAVLAIAERSAAGAAPRLVTASAGNHGRALAWAAERVGLPVTVVTPRAAARTKLDAIRRHGADLRALADDYEHAERLARGFAGESGATFVSAYNDPDVIAGAGTVALELFDEKPDLDAIAVPIGGGGLISGVASVVKAINPGCLVLGVEAQASAAFTAARAAGRLVPIDVKPTIADGLGGNIEVDSITWPLIRDLVDRILLVSEGDLRAAIRDLAAHEHLIAEGAGIAAVAAVAARREPLDGRRVAVIVSGANIDLDRLAPILAG
jgi:threonine dehydratase